MYNLLIVLTDALEGRHDEFNDWYTWVHIRDVMKLSHVVIAVQRFRRARRQLGAPAKYPQNYFTLYETSDPEQMTRDHKPIFTDEMPISDSARVDNICEAYYDPLIIRSKNMGRGLKADLIVESIVTAPADPGFIDWYADNRFSAVMKLPGVVSGTFGQLGRHQMFVGPSPAFTAIYRTVDLDRTLQAWKEAEPPTFAPWDPASISVDCYTPIIDRVTAVEAKEPDPISRETAQRKRAEMGNNVRKSTPGLAIPS